jgi:hypothetical protein
VAIVVLAVRVVACLQDPATALDLERMLYWGLALNEHGLGASSMPLKEFGVPAGVAWRDLPVNYPIIGLMFFKAVAAIIPTVTFGKLVLTGIEALNAFLVGRLAKNRVIGLLYWASPLSIFWVSGEGQFEPVQNLFVLAGMILVIPAPVLAGLAFALAIQTKVSSVIVVAFLFWRSFRRNRLEASKMAAGMVLGFGFSGWAETVTPLIHQILRYSGLSNVSNFGFNPFASTNPTAMWRSLASAALVGLCIYGAIKTKTYVVWLPILGFLLFVKFNQNIQPWYFLLVPMFALLLPNVWNRKTQAVNSLVDLVALVGIAVFMSSALVISDGSQRSRSRLELEAKGGSKTSVASSPSANHQKRTITVSRYNQAGTETAELRLASERYKAMPRSMAASETPSPRAAAASMAITAAGVSRSLSR